MGQEILTTDWTYVRFLGDRKGIEKKTKSWHELIVDRAQAMEEWAPRILGFLDQEIETYAYFNNHYAGHAPGSIRLFLERLRRSNQE